MIIMIEEYEEEKVEEWMKEAMREFLEKREWDRQGSRVNRDLSYLATISQILEIPQSTLVKTVYLDRV